MSNSVKFETSWNLLRIITVCVCYVDISNYAKHMTRCSVLSMVQPFRASVGVTGSSQAF